MILAAGFGTRLWPLTIGRTKPALPFLNRPLIGYAIDYAKRNGIDDLIINLHHEPASVQQQIGDGSNYGARITYSIEEPEILGPAGALDPVRDLLAEDTFVVVNGTIEERIVQLGASPAKGQVSILQNIKPGERVVAHVNEQIADGLRVQE